MSRRDHWYVKETPCYPNSWKVTNDLFRCNNSATEYFPSVKEAQEVADHRNEVKYGH